jgi:predicted signal transduction protein with EAL and GGDEF domain
VEQPANARSLARRLVEVISEPYEVDGSQAIVGVSIGIALAPNDGLIGENLLKNADLALYGAKADGRGTFRFFEAAMDAEMQGRRRLELELRSALANRELSLRFQPLVDLTTDKVCGFEALIRWEHPTRGLVLPIEFVPLAEEIGLIVPIGEWVLHRACQEATTWPDEVGVSVNVSIAQFHAPHLVETVEEALDHSGLAPHRLSLEVTESLLRQDTEATLTTLGRLHGLGVRISLDDFGTGYSSISYLRSFPFDKIKIDKCFLHDLGNGKGSVAILQAIVRLGRALGMTVTAEGIETEEQFTQVVAEGCTEGQGFLFCEPCLPETVGEVMRRLNRLMPAAPELSREPVG